MSNTSHDFYCCIDKKTQIVIWRPVTHGGYPNLQNTDTEITFMYFTGKSTEPMTYEHFTNFEVQISDNQSTAFELKTTQVLNVVKTKLSNFELEKFKLIRTKCQVSYQWLSGIQKTVDRHATILPDIMLYQNAYEHDLLLAERKKIKDNASVLINKYYYRLWQAKTIQEVHGVVKQAILNLNQ